MARVTVPAVVVAAAAAVAVEAVTVPEFPAEVVVVEVATVPVPEYLVVLSPVTNRVPVTVPGQVMERELRAWVTVREAELDRPAAVTTGPVPASVAEVATAAVPAETQAADTATVPAAATRTLRVPVREAVTVKAAAAVATGSVAVTDSDTAVVSGTAAGMGSDTVAGSDTAAVSGTAEATDSASTTNRSSSELWPITADTGSAAVSGSAVVAAVPETVARRPLMANFTTADREVFRDPYDHRTKIILYHYNTYQVDAFTRKIFLKNDLYI